MARFLRQAQILILEIFNIFLRLKFSPSLNLNHIPFFEIGSSIFSFDAQPKTASPPVKGDIRIG